MKVRIYRRDDGKWEWQLTVSGNVVATSHGQGYSRRQDAERMAVRVVGGEFARAMFTLEDSDGGVARKWTISR